MLQYLINVILKTINKIPSICCFSQVHFPFGKKKRKRNINWVFSWLQCGKLMTELSDTYFTLSKKKERHTEGTYPICSRHPVCCNTQTAATSPWPGQEEQYAWLQPQKELHICVTG